VAAYYVSSSNLPSKQRAPCFTFVLQAPAMLYSTSEFKHLNICKFSTAQIHYVTSNFYFRALVPNFARILPSVAPVVESATKCTAKVQLKWTGDADAERETS
jgi:hypothetical protein